MIREEPENKRARALRPGLFCVASDSIYLKPMFDGELPPSGEVTRTCASPKPNPALSATTFEYCLRDPDGFTRLKKLGNLASGERTGMDRWDEAAGPSRRGGPDSAPQRVHAVNAAKRRPAVEHIGLDVHKNQSQICIITSEGEMIEKRISTERDRFQAALGSHPGTRILIEASTESEWVARCLEGLGHEVIVGDPNYAPMYGQRTRRVKTDRRDARALAEACRSGTYRRAHRTSDERRHLRGQLAVREALVRTRTRYISLIRSLLRREGLRVRSGSAERFLERLAEVDLRDHLRHEIQPLLKVMGPLGKQIACMDRQVEKLASEDTEVRRLCTAPGVGPVTATSFVATLDTAQRFRGAHQVEAYIGLVPREKSSGEKQSKGRITKSLGPADCRTAWQARRGRGSGAETGRNPLRHDARWDGVQRHATRATDRSSERYRVGWVESVHGQSWKYNVVSAGSQARVR